MSPERARRAFKYHQGSASNSAVHMPKNLDKLTKAGALNLQMESL